MAWRCILGGGGEWGSRRRGGRRLSRDYSSRLLSHAWWPSRHGHSLRGLRPTWPRARCHSDLVRGTGENADRPQLGGLRSLDGGSRSVADGRLLSPAVGSTHTCRAVPSHLSSACGCCREDNRACNSLALAP